MVEITRTEFPPFHLVKYQCFAAVSANLIIFCHGAAVGWCAPSIWELLTEDSPLTSGKISLNDASWIGSVIFLGSIIGNCLFSFISKYFSGKTSRMLLVLPNLAAWVIVLFANYPFQLIIARVLIGISSGGSYLCVPMFIAEMSNKNIRGIFGSLLPLYSSFGIFFGLVISSYVPFGVTPYIFIIPGLVYICTSAMLPETPQCLLIANKSQEAEKSFRFYNFGNKQKGEMTTDAKLEFEQLCSSIKHRIEDNGSNKVTFRTFLSDGSSLKGTSVGIFLCALNIFSGMFSVNVYTVSIFTEIGTNVDPKISAISITIVHIIGSFVTLILVDRWGRKILLSISCFGSALSLFAFALFAYLQQNNYGLNSFNWIPLTSMAFFVFSNNIGIMPLPYVIITESLPQRTRRIGLLICLLSFGLFAFTNLKFFPILSNILGLYIVMWMYCGVCLLGAIFAVFVLEETKGKMLDS